MDNAIAALLSSYAGVALGAFILSLRMLKTPERWRDVLRDAGGFTAAAVLLYLLQVIDGGRFLALSSETASLQAVLVEIEAAARSGVPLYALLAPYLLAWASLAVASLLAVALTLGAVLAPALLAARGLLGGYWSPSRFSAWLASAGFAYTWLVFVRLGIGAAVGQWDALVMLALSVTLTAAGVFIYRVGVRVAERLA